MLRESAQDRAHPVFGAALAAHPSMPAMHPSLSFVALSLAGVVLVGGCGAGSGDASSDGPTGETTSALNQCVTTTVKGVDVYEYDLPVDWSRLKSEGYEFAIIKATESTYDSQSGTFPSSYAGARAAGLIVGAYHFFRGDADGTAQANAFLAVAGPHLAAGDLPLSLDIETTDGASGAQITQRMWDFIHTIETKTGKKPLVYTYSSYFSGAGVNTTGLEKYPLWLAPAHNTPTCFDSGMYGLPWTKATIWQFDSTTALGGISNKAADRDQFIGSLSDLQAFARGTPATSPQINGNGAMSAVEWPTDGHLELFVTAGGGAQHVWTNGASTTWHKAMAYNGKAGCGLASSIRSESAGTVAQVFSAEGGGNTEEVHLGPVLSNPWTDFTDFGGPGLGALSTAVGPDGHAEVYALAADGTIHANVANATTGAFAGWKAIGGKVATGAAPIVHEDGSIELFATDTAGAAWHATETKGVWSAWTTLGGALASRPVPARYPDGHVAIFARGTDGFTWSSEWTGGKFPAFAKIDSATSLAGEIAAVMNPNGSPELFARRSDGVVVHMYWDSAKKAWSAWSSLGATGASQKAASDPLGWVRADGTADAFVVDPTGALVAVHRGPNQAWGAWAPIATGIDACAATSPPGGPPASDGGAPHNGAGPPANGDPASPGAQDGSSGSGGCSVATRTPGGGAGGGPIAFAFLALAALATAWTRRRVGQEVSRLPTPEA